MFVQLLKTYITTQKKRYNNSPLTYEFFLRPFMCPSLPNAIFQFIQMTDRILQMAKKIINLMIQHNERIFSMLCIEIEYYSEKG